jgi:hypothetical protein
VVDLVSLPSFEDAEATAADRSPFSNGFEWDVWSARWCHRCLNDANEDCPLILVAMLGKTPSQWVEGEILGLETRYSCNGFEDLPDGNVHVE